MSKWIVWKVVRICAQNFSQCTRVFHKQRRMKIRNRKQAWKKDKTFSGIVEIHFHDARHYPHKLFFRLQTTCVLPIVSNPTRNTYKSFYKFFTARDEIVQNRTMKWHNTVAKEAVLCTCRKIKIKSDCNQLIVVLLRRRRFRQIPDEWCWTLPCWQCRD